MNKIFKEFPPPLLRIHIDDMSNIKPMDTNRLPQMKERLSEANIRIAKNNMHIVTPATSPCIVSIGGIFSIVKALMEMGDTDIQYDGGERALDVYYKASSCTLYWDASHTNKAVILNMRVGSSSVEDTIHERITHVFGDSIIFHNKSIMLIDAHGECEAVMGRITRICDMLSYEIFTNPHISNDKYNYVSIGGDDYISIIKMNP